MKGVLYILLLLMFPTTGISQLLKEYTVGQKAGLSIYTDKVLYVKNQADSILYKTNKANRGGNDLIEVTSSKGLDFSIVFFGQNVIKIFPYNLIVKTNDELYKYLKKSIFENNEIQNIGIIFYPINRFYDDSILYFNEDIFIKDWDKNIYSSKFKILSVVQYDQDKMVLKGEYFYEGDVLMETKYFSEDNDNDFVEFYSEKLLKKRRRNSQYSFVYRSLDEKYIVRGRHFRNKNARVIKAVSTEEHMADASKFQKNTYWYPWPNVEIKVLNNKL